MLCFCHHKLHLKRVLCAMSFRRRTTEIFMFVQNNFSHATSMRHWRPFYDAHSLHFSCRSNFHSRRRKKPSPNSHQHVSDARQLVIVNCYLWSTPTRSTLECWLCSGCMSIILLTQMKTISINSSARFLSLINSAHCKLCNVVHLIEIWNVYIFRKSRTWHTQHQWELGKLKSY